jgi:predicted dienelactone hydrolase/cyclophilin family peptidyl-prolyl cis-trans isomerase
MLLIDLIALASTVAAIYAWWNRDSAAVQHLLVPTAVIGLVVSIAGVLDDRWQLAPLGLVAFIVLLSGLVRRFSSKGGHTGLPWITGSLFTLALLAGAFLLYLFPATDLPEPSGPHAVGVTDFMLSDESRPGLLAAGPDEPRKLLVRAWYPATGVEGMRARPYFSEGESETTARGMGLLAGAPFYFTYLKHVQSNSFERAPLLAREEKLPVVFYSHGYTSFPGQNTVLMEELASHGYIVYAIAHTYDSSPVLFPDGSVAPMDPALIVEMQAQLEGEAAGESEDGFAEAFVAQSMEARYQGLLANQRKSVEDGSRIPTVSADIWLDDRLFVHDELDAGRVPDHIAEIAVAGDLSRTGEMGMSFGGSTSGGICMVDARCAAGVNLDGGDYHLQPWLKNVPVPFLMFYSDYARLYEMLGGDPGGEARGFNDFSYERPELAGLRDDVVRLTVKNASHLGVSDFNLFMRNPVREAMLGPIDGARMVQIQNDFVRAFFDTHLIGNDVGFPSAQFELHQADVAEDSVHAVREWWLATHSEDETVLVRFQTNLGDVEVALYPARAPISVANFLAYVDAGHYKNASFYRSLKPSGPYGYGVIQGGLLQAAMAGDGSEYAEPERLLPPIAHETTDQTGIPNERGTLAYARLAPGSAGSEIFFNITDNAVLDTGAQVPGRDGQGYATFGRVLKGLRVLEAIQTLPTDGATDMESLRGQILREPVRIHRIMRID